MVPTILQRRTTQLSLKSIIVSAKQVPGAQVILVANGPGERNPRIRIDSSLVTVIPCEQASAAAARNIGLHAANHSIVLFTDDDCIVPPTWCIDLARAFKRPEVMAVAAPVSVGVQGPVTAFLDYQRIFDAPPIDEKRTRYLITANCGVRWNVLRGRISFDDLNFVVGGEDTEFGYAIRDLGYDIHWLGSLRPVRHIIPESIDEITERFTRYSQASARLFTRRKRGSESVPTAVDWLKEISLGQYYEYRRFAELTEPLIQRAFTSFELMLSSAFLIGYLDELGNTLGYRFVSPDYDELRTIWRQISGELMTSLDGKNQIWSSLPIDYGQWTNRLESCKYQRPSPRIAENVRQNAPLTASVPPDMSAILKSSRSQILAAQNHQRKKLYDLASAQWEHITKNPQSLEYYMRRVGISFRDGCHEIEKIMYHDTMLQ